MADDGDYNGGTDEDLDEDDQDTNGDQGNRSDQQQLQGDNRMESLNENEYFFFFLDRLILFFVE
jgi:hypothetical protein